MNLQQYYDLLDKHDWYYQYSDDTRIWLAGNREHDKLVEIAKESSAHDALYEAFSNHHFSGDAFGSVEAPKPERPND